MLPHWALFQNKLRHKPVNVILSGYQLSTVPELYLKSLKRLSASVWFGTNQSRSATTATSGIVFSNWIRIYTADKFGTYPKRTFVPLVFLLFHSFQPCVRKIRLDDSFGLTHVIDSVQVYFYKPPLIFMSVRIGGARAGV